MQETEVEALRTALTDVQKSVDAERARYSLSLRGLKVRSPRSRLCANPHDVTQLPLCHLRWSVPTARPPVLAEYNEMRPGLGDRHFGRTISSYPAPTTIRAPPKRPTLAELTVDHRRQWSVVALK